ncbi:MAG: amidinotransferase [Bdellovibrionaceae bacterium]|nr:amidinotransferase [Pseudobdellovibrionaceae bacterium]
MWPKNVLMVNPKYFDVAYAINPHMMDEQGKLKQIDHHLASEQWLAIKNKFSELGVRVCAFDGIENLPDMVFCANPLLPFLKNGRTHFIASNMSSTFRTAEVDHACEWATQNNFEIYKLPQSIRFEGMGDALWNYDTLELFGGYGFRTDKAAYDYVEDIIERPVIRLQLINENFYHLDTALCIVDRNTALVVRSALSEESLDKLHMKFKNLIFVEPSEAKDYLAANAVSVDGRHVLVEKNAVSLQKQLQMCGYTVHPMDTSEFIKSGGSIFCMKLLLWDELRNITAASAFAPVFTTEFFY